MVELNEPQRHAVAHAEGPLLVFAGAGSGKTRVITYRIANLLAQHYVPPYRILAVTFTNKAAGEMRARLEAIAGEDVARDLWVGTFHSTCAKLLRRYHDEVGLGRDYVIYDDSDQKALLTRIIRDRNLSERAYPPKQVLSRIHRFKREAIRPEKVELDYGIDEETVDLYARYQDALKNCNAVDFEDLIVHVMRIAEDPDSAAGKELRGRYRYVLVDEFQDTNHVQYRLVRALAAEHRNLCVVGDDDQSIYSWRGADIRNILGFRHDFPEAEVVKLEQNYRSTRNIVAGALGIIRGASQREDKELWSDAEQGDPIRVRAVRDEREEAAAVVRTIASEGARGTPYSEIAVFYRVHAQSRVLEEALRGERIAYQIIGGMKFFERAEVKNLLAYLRLLMNPRSDADLVRVINVPTRGIGGKTLDRLLATAALRDTSAYDAIDATLGGSELKTGPKKKLGAFQKLIEGLRTEVPKRTPHELAELVLERTGYREQLEQEDTAESDARLENLAELVGAIQEYEAEAEQTGEPPTLSGYLERVSLVADVDTMRDEDCVTLMTVHGAKGLEFDTVLLTGMEEETFPYRGLDGHSPEELDEERRLAYVAVTRARKRLWITHASMRTIFGQTKYLAPSRFLADLPGDVVEAQGSPWGAERAGYGRRSPVAQPARPTAPRLAPGERVVDYDAFDDVAEGFEVSPGDRCFHQRFGSGIVESVVPGPQPAVVARFPGFGQRKIRAEFLSFGER